MSLANRFSPFFTRDQIADKNGRLTNNWVKSFDELISGLNQFLKTGRESAVLGNNQSTFNCIKLTEITTTDRDKITNWSNGALILNTTVNKVQAYVAGAWVDLH